MNIRFWDMDHTLIDNDCDVSWKDFLIAEKIAPPEAKELADMFFRQYQENKLDWEGFMAFQLAELDGLSAEAAAVLAMKHFVDLVNV